MDTPQNVTDYPPMQGQEYDWHDGRYRIWTFNEAPYGRFPTYADGGPPIVTHAEWGVSFPRLCKVMSSPSVVAADDGKIELSIRQIKYKPEGGCDIIRHPLDGTKYDTDADARRAAYEAGVIAYMVYVKDEAKYGL